MRRRVLVGLTVAATIGGLYLWNASWLAPVPQGRPLVEAHRGIHQTFDRTNLTQRDCTARRMRPPTNPYLENTIGSMRASFAAGADEVELDVHPTTDGEFAVFHDWTLECRTNGKGVTRQQSMAYLRTLDLGYGYTADGGKTYPFRGKFVGQMKTLHEILTAFPAKSFLINIKSDDPTEVDALVAYLRARGHPTDRRLRVVASDAILDRLAMVAPEARRWSVRRTKSCSIRYIALGWMGYVPESCRHGFIGVPVNAGWAFWGWPNRFLQRMRDADVEVVVAGPIGNKSGDPGLTDPTQLDAVPQHYDGRLLTDDVERIGPAVLKRWPRQSAR